MGQIIGRWFLMREKSGKENSNRRDVQRRHSSFTKHEPLSQWSRVTPQAFLPCSSLHPQTCHCSCTSCVCVACRCALCMTRTRHLCCLLIQSFRHPRVVCFPQRSSTTHLEPTNQHLSVEREDGEVADLTFVSEALGMPAMKGQGWAQFEFGDQIGQDNRYTIVRKLGWGMFSSTWLARDSTSVYRQLS